MPERALVEEHELGMGHRRKAVLLGLTRAHAQSQLLVVPSHTSTRTDATTDPVISSKAIEEPTCQRPRDDGGDDYHHLGGHGSLRC